MRYVYEIERHLNGHPTGQFEALEPPSFRWAEEAPTSRWNLSNSSVGRVGELLGESMKEMSLHEICEFLQDDLEFVSMNFNQDPVFSDVYSRCVPLGMQC